jgi:hypothetical protein
VARVLYLNTRNCYRFNHKKEISMKLQESQCLLGALLFAFSLNLSCRTTSSSGEKTTLLDSIQADTIRGQHGGHGYQVSVNGTTALLSWDDGSNGFSAQLNRNPHPAPRCPCDIFDGPDGQRLILEKDSNAGGYISVSYKRLGGGSGGNASTIAGYYRGFGYKVSVSDLTATLSWDDGTRGFSAELNPNPNPQPGCPCDIFDGPDGRRLTLEKDLSTGGYTSVEYDRNGAVDTSSSISGNHQGFGYVVGVSGSQATLSWDDGTRGFIADLNDNPNPQPRCPCEIFDGPDGRRLTLEKDFSSGGYSSVTYARFGARQ